MSTLLPTSHLEEIAWKPCALLGTQKVDPYVVAPSHLSVETGLGYFSLSSSWKSRSSWWVGEERQEGETDKARMVLRFASSYILKLSIADPFSGR